jgi:hypothetical protein
MTQTGQTDLRAVLPPGLELACDFVTPDEEAELIARIEASGITHVDYDPGNPRGERTYQPDDEVGFSRRRALGH